MFEPSSPYDAPPQKDCEPRRSRVSDAAESGDRKPDLDGCNTYAFAREQGIFDHALSRLKVLGEGSPCTGREYAALVAEYGRLLQQARNAADLTDSMSREILDLQNLMQQDPLTGIHNRRYLEDNLDRIVKTLRRSGGELGVLMMDIDFFKQYNDMYGHHMGDVSLKKVAAALKRPLSRADDFVVRYGGEEFTAILPNTGERGVRIVAEKMLASVRECNIPYECNGISTCVTVSVGATSGKVTRARNGGDFVKLADEALFHAKSRGRGRSVFQNFL